MSAMLIYRLIFGPLLIVGLIAVFIADSYLDQVNLQGSFVQTIFLGRTYLPAGLMLLACIVVLIGFGAREFSNMFRAKNIYSNTFLIWLSGTTGAVLIYIIPSSTDSQTTTAIYATALAAIFVLSLLLYAWRYQKTTGVIAVAGVTLLAMIYLGILPGFYLAIRRWHSTWIVLGILLITKSCDIGAFFTGKAIGKHKMIPWLSPGKTWEGLGGGVIFSAAVAAILTWIANSAGLSGHWSTTGHHFLNYNYPLWYGAIAGIVIGLVGQFGDLTASLFKRDAGIKDSGQLIPGMGGLLDLTDSPIIVAPVAYWLLQIATLLH